MTLNISFFIGWHTDNTIHHASIGCTDDEDESFSPVVFNILRIIGYFPVLGLLAGIGNIACLISYKDDISISARVFLVVRSTLEIMGLGIVFLIPDAIVSLHRACRPPDPDSVLRG